MENTISTISLQEKVDGITEQVGKYYIYGIPIAAGIALFRYFNDLKREDRPPFLVGAIQISTQALAWPAIAFGNAASILHNTLSERQFIWGMTYTLTTVTGNTGPSVPAVPTGPNQGISLVGKSAKRKVQEGMVEEVEKCP